MNRRQHIKRALFLTECEKEWRTIYKYHVPFYLIDHILERRIKVTSRHKYLQVMKECVYYQAILYITGAKTKRGKR